MTQTEINGYKVGDQIILNKSDGHTTCCRGGVEIYGVILNDSGTKRVKIMESGMIIADDMYDHYKLVGILPDE